MNLEENTMEEKIYTVTRIEGDYAYIADESREELFIALALLPIGADVGSRLSYLNFEFTLIG